jgi:coenzyme F420-reducing hydrogenase delta subunit
VRLEWVSASEGDRFATIVNEMTEQVRQLGPFSGNGGSKNG